MRRPWAIAAGALALPAATVARPAPPAAPKAPAAVAPDSADPGVQSVLNCDAITYRGMLDAPTMSELEPIHTLDGVAAVLKRRGIVFDRRKATLTLNLVATVRAQIDVLPPGEPIVLPARDGGVVCVLLPSPDSI